MTYTGVNIRDLKLIPLAIPPVVEEQEEIVCRVNALFEFTDRLQLPGHLHLTLVSYIMGKFP